jgi:hypothetical protein
MKKLLTFVASSIVLFSFITASGQDKNVTAIQASKSQSYSTLNKEGTVILYKYQHLAHSPKDAPNYAPTYFFTTNTSDVLQPLSKDNLKKAFPGNHPFHDALDATFNSDKDLIAYDSFHNMYKVNWLLQQHP